MLKTVRTRVAAKKQPIEAPTSVPIPVNDKAPITPKSNAKEFSTNDQAILILF